MRDYLTIGSSPWEEDCAQVGRDDYHSRSKMECKAFINMIRRVIGPEPEHANLRVKSFPHDFGTYVEVVCYYDDEDRGSLDYALKCEGSSLLANWDTEAQKDLHVHA